MVLAVLGAWSHGGSTLEKQRGSRGCVREELKEEEGQRERMCGAAKGEK
jgi:hypothetical protein